jgi:metallo-beta-lactamase class B
MLKKAQNNGNDSWDLMMRECEELIRQGCERPWEVAVKPFKVTPHTYYVGNSWVGAYLIDTGEGLILIDTTMQPQVYLVFESIRKLGFDPREIKIILLSHAHYDHCGGGCPLIKYNAAKIYMGKEDEFLLKERRELLYTLGYPFGNFQADEYFDDNKPITLGAVTINTLHTPGHTPGTTSFFFEDQDEKGNLYHCGMHGGLGLNTLDDKYFKESGLSVSLRDSYLKSLLKMRDLKIDITIGSHPSQINMLEKVKYISDLNNPFIDNTAWKKLMDEKIIAVQKLIEESNRNI